MSGVRHPVFARVYRGLAGFAEGRGLGDLRSELLAGLAGTVVEVGAGHGPNFAHYPETVSEVVAVEPERFLRAKAAEASAVARVPVRVVDGLGDALPLPDGSADAVVFCLVLCSVPDQAAVLAEARRVLRPGGEVRFLEHVRAHRPGRMRTVQRGLDATVWPWLAGGCHLARDTESAIEAVFSETEVRRFRFPEGSRGPESFAVLGRAVRA